MMARSSKLIRDTSEYTVHSIFSFLPDYWYIYLISTNYNGTRNSEVINYYILMCATAPAAFKLRVHYPRNTIFKNQPITTGNVPRRIALFATAWNQFRIPNVILVKINFFFVTPLTKGLLDKNIITLNCLTFISPSYQSAGSCTRMTKVCRW